MLQWPVDYGQSHGARAEDAIDDDLQVSDSDDEDEGKEEEEKPAAETHQGGNGGENGNSDSDPEDPLADEDFYANAPAEEGFDLGF